MNALQQVERDSKAHSLGWMIQCGHDNEDGADHCGDCRRPR